VHPAQAGVPSKVVEILVLELLLVENDLLEDASILAVRALFPQNE